MAISIRETCQMMARDSIKACLHSDQVVKVIIWEGLVTIIQLQEQEGIMEKVLMAQEIAENPLGTTQI